MCKVNVHRHTNTSTFSSSKNNVIIDPKVDNLHGQIEYFKNNMGCNIKLDLKLNKDSHYLLSKWSQLEYDTQSHFTNAI